MSSDISVEINEKEFQECMETLVDMYDSIDETYLKNTLKRKAKPITDEMKRRSPSERLPEVIGISTAKKRTGGLTTVKYGVIKNDVTLFPKFSSFALASVLEYGTRERFRKVTTSIGFISGRAPTGKMTPERFIRKSVDNNLSEVIKDFESTITKRVNKKAK